MATASAPVSTPAGRRPLPPLSPRAQTVRAAFLMVLVLSGSLLVHLLLLSQLQHSAWQQRAFASFRERLALGTAPIGPVDENGALLDPGTPIAYLEIPSIGVTEVVVDGTSSAQLFGAVGLRRDTRFPGQVGTSLIVGRAAAYGGPFSDVADLRDGDAIAVTTAQGRFDYRVSGVHRSDGVALSVPPSNAARLVLATADGAPFLPAGTVTVEADLVGTPAVGARPVFSASGLPSRERLGAGDTSRVWALVLWMQALLVTAVGAVWAWHRLGRARTWILFTPPCLFVGLAVADEVCRLLPNVL